MNKVIKCKCWIEEDNERFFGPGPNQLLKGIQSEGSLSKAAGLMNMSYKKAWEIVQRLNHHSKQPLVILKKGGPHGGGAEITPYGIKVMLEYDKLQKKINDLLIEQDELMSI
ncbi:winged helix-turn-helix domain-containing protein [Marinigracilibium pacificum]|uniref:LysR family transcriptional regulator n=1 Tax=Marinigracilibium pacificum TaxID=2729599 RepID=A0A848IYE6_9BACT|nr:winged helix-turn-helix domain-containing protein [Marinigracilibium pacificum]NMM48305.1 LysR family transcriptional regulator [Marinigracilibium pacificum]